MLDLSAVAILEKNKLEPQGVWLILLEISHSKLEDSIRLVRNTENITWNGFEWIAFPFDFGNVTESSNGEMPSVQLKVSNITRALQTYLEDADGGIGATVNLRIINTMNMASNIPEVEEKFIVNKTTVAYDWVTFDLGGGSILNSRFPSRRILKNNCSFKYKEIECGCTSAYTDCNHTLADCRIRKNSYRFGGEPGIMQGGIYID